MTALCGFLLMLCLVTTPILAIIFIVKWVKKKPKKKIGIITLVAFAGIFVFTFLGVAFDPTSKCEHQYEVENKIEATCTEEGYTSYHCPKCDDVEKKDKVATIEHDFKETSVKKATEKAKGKIVYECSMCKKTKTEVLAKLPKGKSSSLETPVSSDVEVTPSESEQSSSDTTYVSLEDGQALKEIAGEYAKSVANRPSTVEFDSMSWWVMRDDTTYTVEGYFTCDNGFGVSEKYKINVICYMSEDNELLVWIVAVNDKPIVDNTEALFGEQ